MRLESMEQAVARMDQWGRVGQPFVFVIDYAGRLAYVRRRAEVEESELLFDLDGFSNCPADSHEGKCVFQWTPRYLSFERYARSFRIVTDHIRRGDSYLVNLTCATPVESDLSLREIFDRSRARYRLLVPDHFVVFSPETFVRMEGGFIYSYPMKGTIDGDLPDAEAHILGDPKETAEHATIVDLIRNDLSTVASEVCVPRYRYIDRLRTNGSTLLQVSSEVRGRLPADWQGHIGSIIARLLPAGSISGAPKCRTMEIIAEAEGYERGFYTGVMGCFDGERLDSAVMIRFVECNPAGGYLFKSGGGITAQSDLQLEYEEMKQKIYVPIY